MPINAKPEYYKAEKKFYEADTIPDKLKALREMLSLAPKHKGAENLLKEIKTKISKYQELLKKQKTQKKGSKYSVTIKKEGAASIAIIGTTNSGKSTLLKELTNASPLIASYKFTTKKPEIGTLDYKGIKLQIIELPAIFENYEASPKGPQHLAIARTMDLLILTFRNEEEQKLVTKELEDLKVKKIYYNKEKNFKDLIWNNLNLIKIFTKQPSKKPSYPPLALKKNSTVKDLAIFIHKDFIKKFKFARIWGSSVKFNSQKVGLNYKLEDDDIVELHLK